MQNERKISEKITIGGLPDDIDLQEFKERGAQTVVSFLTNDEPGFDEKARVEAAGLRHVSIPVSVDCLSDETVEKLVQTIDESAGEVVLHCKGGGRAGVMALLYLARKNGWDAQTAREEGAKFDAKIGEGSLYKPFFDSYVSRAAKSE